MPRLCLYGHCACDACLPAAYYERACGVVLPYRDQFHNEIEMPVNPPAGLAAPQPSMPVDAKRRQKAFQTRPRPEATALLQVPVLRGLALPTAASNDPYNMFTSLAKRIDTSKPPSTGPITRQPNVQALENFSWYWAQAHLRPFPPDLPFDFDGWLSTRTNYTAAAKAQIQAAHDSAMARQPRTPHERELQRLGLPIFQSEILRGRVPRDRVVKGFIKHECETEFKPARGINSRPAARHFWGPVAELISMSVMSLGCSNPVEVTRQTVDDFRRGAWHPEFDESHLPMFIKYVPVHERSRFIEALRVHGERFIGTDYSSFEALQTPAIMRATLRPVYRWLTSQNPALRAVVDTMLDVMTGVNFVDLPWFSYAVAGCRMSGEMDTSLGNGLTNLLMVNFIAHSLGCTMTGFVEGDDGIFAVRGRVPDVACFFANGLKVKMEESLDPAVLSFCGNVYDPTVMTNVTDPLRQLVKFPWFNDPTCTRISAARSASTARMKAMSLMAEYRRCPVVHAYAARVLELTQHADLASCSSLDYWDQQVLSSVSGDLSAKMRGWVSETVPLANRVLVERLYGLSVDTQLRLEDQIRAWKPGLIEPPDLPWPSDWRTC